MRSQSVCLWLCFKPLLYTTQAALMLVASLPSGPRDEAKIKPALLRQFAVRCRRVTHRSLLVLRLLFDSAMLRRSCAIR